MRHLMWIIPCSLAAAAGYWLIENTLLLNANDRLGRTTLAGQFISELHHGPPPCLRATGMESTVPFGGPSEAQVDTMVEELKAAHLDAKRNSLIEWFFRWQNESERRYHQEDDADEFVHAVMHHGHFLDRIVFRLNEGKMLRAGHEADRAHENIFIEEYGGGPALTADEQAALEAFWRRHQAEVTGRYCIRLFAALRKK